MATEIQTWQIVNGKLTTISSSLVENKRREKEDLEAWIKSNPEILGRDIFIIGQQVQTKSGPLDFLGVDTNGNTVVVELKRETLPRNVLAQVIDYASDIASWDIDKLSEVSQAFTGQPLADFLSEKLQGKLLEDLAINQAQRLLLVGFAVEEALSRMVEWLSSNYNVGVNVIVLNYVRTKSGDELLSRTVIIPEEVEREKTNKKKFIIEMSNEPGSYDRESLKEQLRRYLSKNQVSPQRIRDYFIPILLKKGTVTREQMRKEFVKMGAAPDESQAGYFLSLISGQLGHKGNDYLRQVIAFETPNKFWEKDNFKIREDYKDLVEEVLAELKAMEAVEHHISQELIEMSDVDKIKSL